MHSTFEVQTARCLRSADAIIRSMRGASYTEFARLICNEGTFHCMNATPGVRLVLSAYVMIGFYNARMRNEDTRDDHRAEDLLSMWIPREAKRLSDLELDVGMRAICVAAKYVSMRAVNASHLVGMREGIEEEPITPGEPDPLRSRVRKWILGWKRFLPWVEA